jgi:hypothetical protein
LGGATAFATECAPDLTELSPDEVILAYFADPDCDPGDLVDDVVSGDVDTTDWLPPSNPEDTPLEVRIRIYEVTVQDLSGLNCTDLYWLMNRGLGLSREALGKASGGSFHWQVWAGRAVAATQVVSDKWDDLGCGQR